MAEAIVFRRVYLPRPIAPEAVARLLTRLAASDVARPVAFELRAGDAGLAYFLGGPRADLPRLRRLVSDALPGAVFEKSTRFRVASAGRVVADRAILPVRSADPVALVADLLSAAATRRRGETLVLQLVLGGARYPERVAARAPDPLQTLSSRLWRGVERADGDTRRRLRAQAGSLRLTVTVRVGVDAPASPRRAALARGTLGALQSLQDVGIRLRLRRERSDGLEAGLPARGGLHLSPEQLVPLLGWPLGDRDYPGTNPLHPKRLPVPKALPKDGSVFGVGTAPGPERRVAIGPSERLHHSVAIGPTGSGKSALLEHLILSDVEAGRACVVVEPKRQLVDGVLDRLPISAAGRVVVIDAADEAPVGFNPCELGPGDDPYVVADNLLAALAAIFEDGWGPRTEYLIQGALVSLLVAGQRRAVPFTLIDLPRILTDSALRREVTPLVGDDPGLAAFWAEYEEMPVRQRTAQIAAPLNKLRKLVMRRNLVAVLGQPSPRFRLREVFGSGMTVLVPLNEALIGKGAARLLGSLVVAELWTATLARAAEPGPWKRPGMVFIDEVQNYLHLPTDVGDAMATSRSYGVAWHVAHQFRAQLPPAMRAGFDTNARNKFAFSLGPDDARDLARFAPDLAPEDFQLLGKYEIYARLVADGAQADWFSARTLPPRKVVGAGDRIRADSRRLYGSAHPAEPATQLPTPPVDQGLSVATRPDLARGQKARQR